MQETSLVIHDGQLMLKEKALALMLEEFMPYGYTAPVIENLVERAFKATQSFLAGLVYQPQVLQKVHLDISLKNDAEIAALYSYLHALPPAP